MKSALCKSLSLGLAICLLASPALAQSPVPEGAKVDKLAGGFKFTEGPVWDGKTLIFSDIPNNKLMRFTPGKGISVYKELEGSCNGTRLDADGNLLVCQPKGRALISISPEGEVTTLADSYNGKKLNSPNDLWIDPKGGVYFTDPRYGSMDGLEQDGFHVYYLSPEGKLTRVLDNLVKPNGVIGTADGKTLFVTDPGDSKTYRYDIGEDGSLANRKLAAPAGSDGLAVDNHGNLYITGAPMLVFSPEGKQIAEIPLPEKAANMTFGGKDGNILFITARTSLYAIKLNATDGSNPFAEK